MAGAQETQQTRWPQGRRIIPTTAEKQILQVSCVIMSLILNSTGECASSSPVEVEVEDVVGCCELLTSALVFMSCASVYVEGSEVWAGFSGCTSCTTCGSLSQAAIRFV